MTITLRQKDLENDNKSLYLDIYENGKRKFEFLSLYLIPEINQETKERNEATLKRAPGDSCRARPSSRDHSPRKVT